MHVSLVVALCPLFVVEAYGSKLHFDTAEMHLSIVGGTDVLQVGLWQTTQSYISTRAGMHVSVGAGTCVVHVGLVQHEPKLAFPPFWLKAPISSSSFWLPAILQFPLPQAPIPRS